MLESYLVRYRTACDFILGHSKNFGFYPGEMICYQRELNKRLAWLDIFFKDFLGCSEENMLQRPHMEAGISLRSHCNNLSKRW